MTENGQCLVLSMNLLNWGMYGAVSPAKVRLVCDCLADTRPDLLCLSEVGPNDALEQLTGPLQERGLRYVPVSVGEPNKRGIRNAVLGREGLEVVAARLRVPRELVIAPLKFDNFELGGMRLSLSREPLAVLVRTCGMTLAVGFFHPKSKLPEDPVTGKSPESVRDQAEYGLCKLMSSMQNFGQCLLAREWVDRFWEHNPPGEDWNTAPGDVRFVLVGDWNANPQEEQRRALQGYPEAGLPRQTLLVDALARSTTDVAEICTIPWGGFPSSFDAILVDHVLEPLTSMRILQVNPVDFYGLPDAEREKLENEVLDHCPVGLFLKAGACS